MRRVFVYFPDLVQRVFASPGIASLEPYLIWVKSLPS